MPEKHTIGYEKRRSARRKTLYLVTYIAESQFALAAELNSGKILDISQNGMRIETFDPLYTNALIKAEIHTEIDIIPAAGNVVYAREFPPGTYIAGIEFNRAHTEFAHI